MSGARLRWTSVCLLISPVVMQDIWKIHDSSTVCEESHQQCILPFHLGDREAQWSGWASGNSGQHHQWLCIAIEGWTQGELGSNEACWESYLKICSCYQLRSRLVREIFRSRASKKWKVYFLSILRLQVLWHWKREAWVSSRNEFRCHSFWTCYWFTSQILEVAKVVFTCHLLLTC